jgi:hypothetical protein
MLPGVAASPAKKIDSSITTTKKSPMKSYQAILNFLKTILLVARADFSEANRKIDSFYAKCREENASKLIISSVETIIAQLQCLDIFTQRIQHIIEAQETVTNLYLDDLFKNSFLHLQYFQLQMIENDLRKSISVIEVNALTIDRLVGTTTTQGFTSVFSHYTEIKRLLLNVKIRLRKESYEMTWLQMPPLTNGQIRFFMKLYTMESERIVLNWFIKNMPSGTARQLQENYTRQLGQLQVESTEIF